MTLAGALRSVIRDIIATGLRSAATVWSSSVLGSQSGRARRTSSWWMNISATLAIGSSSLNGEYSGGPSATCPTSTSQSVDADTWCWTRSV